MSAEKDPTMRSVSPVLTEPAAQAENQAVLPRSRRPRYVLALAWADALARKLRRLRSGRRLSAYDPYDTFPRRLTAGEEERVAEILSRRLAR